MASLGRINAPSVALERPCGMRLPVGSALAPVDGLSMVVILSCYDSA